MKAGREILSRKSSLRCRDKLLLKMCSAEKEIKHFPSLENHISFPLNVSSCSNLRSFLETVNSTRERKFRKDYLCSSALKPVASRQYLNKHSSVGAIKSRIFSLFSRNKPDTQRTIRFFFFPGRRRDGKNF